MKVLLDTADIIIKVLEEKLEKNVAYTKILENTASDNLWTIARLEEKIVEKDKELARLLTDLAKAYDCGHDDGYAKAKREQNDR